tara:strand:+ start:1336 stop:1650 length:315 start_codon:yes stop_codon:yes gene_type:complete
MGIARLRLFVQLPTRFVHLCSCLLHQLPCHHGTLRCLCFFTLLDKQISISISCLGDRGYVIGFGIGCLGGHRSYVPVGCGLNGELSSADRQLRRAFVLAFAVGR